MRRKILAGALAAAALTAGFAAPAAQADQPVYVNAFGTQVGDSSQPSTVRATVGRGGTVTQVCATVSVRAANRTVGRGVCGPH